MHTSRTSDRQRQGPLTWIMLVAAAGIATLRLTACSAPTSSRAITPPGDSVPSVRRFDSVIHLYPDTVRR